MAVVRPGPARRGHEPGARRPRFSVVRLRADLASEAKSARGGGSGRDHGVHRDDPRERAGDERLGLDPGGDRGPRPGHGRRLWAAWGAEGESELMWWV